MQKTATATTTTTTTTRRASDRSPRHSTGSGVPTGLIRVGTLLFLLAAVGARGEVLSVTTSSGVAIGQLDKQYIDGGAYVAAEDVRAVFDGVNGHVEFRYRYTPAVGKITVQLRADGARATARCRVGDAEVEIAGSDPVTLSQPPVDRDGAVWLPLEFLILVAPATVQASMQLDMGGTRLTVRPSVGDEEAPDETPREPPQAATDAELPYKSTPARRSAWSQLRVMVDAGHGGSDEGVSLNGLTEKTLALELAREVARVARSVGGLVALTRDADASMTAAERIGRAEGRRSTVYLALHFNSSLSPARSGYRLVVSGATDGLAAERLSDALHAGLGEAGLVGEQAVLPLVTLRGAAMPAAHLEMAYLSSPEEARLWLNPTTRRRAAEAIWAGLSAYRP
ncbi:hypothetical protein CMK11_22140 [Candidatus Poribacteria bacterium]|nr:hypothetical protein [Candidatus Poribacteria bacterium]